MKKNLLYILTMVALLISCTDEQVNNVSPYNGQEVKFSVNLGANNSSRTLYGDEATDGSSVRVNWVHGDNVTVFGTTCAVKQANYSVNTKDEKGNIQSGLNYATSLDKTGANGVQWGNEASDFYAIYPAVTDYFSKNDDNGEITVTTQVAQYQQNKFTLVGDTCWVGTPYVDDLENPSMSNALMYAYTPKAKSSDNNGIVNLTFKPFSTVLKFKLNGWEVHNDMTDEVSSEAVVTVNKITIKAPVPVVGECDFTFVDGIPTVSGGEYNDIVIYPNQLLLEQGQSVEFNAFAIPQEYIMTSGEPWTVIVETDYGTYNYKIAPSTDATLAEGQIHKINIPNIQINQGAVDLESSEWMKWIPRNVYLSELSLPGAWYATDANYQTTTDLAVQYENGIRAFHIDCRMSYDDSSWGMPSGNLVLTAAGTESNVLVYTPGIKVETKLAEIATAFNANPSEYVVVVLTIAEKYMDRDLGNDGNVNPSDVLTAIATMIDTYKDTWNIYTDKITSNTTVNDVLGHMIIKVNVNTTLDKYTTYTTVPATLLSEASMASDTNYITGDIVAGTFTKMMTRDMYFGKTATDLKYYYHQAQLTTNSDSTTDGTGTPSFGDRKAAIDNIINQSATIYSNNLHNGWFQLGIGGYIKPSNTEDRATVASTLNPYVLTKVNAKLESNPSPIGIVLMNFCTNNDYSSVDLTNAIIKMNTKFYLNRDMTQEEWPNGNPYNPGQGEDNGES